MSQWPLRRILVTTDGSPGADRAVEYAAHLAKFHGSELLIVNVVGQELPDELFLQFTQAQQAWVKELFQSLSAQKLTRAQELAHRIGVATVQLQSRTGDVAQAIIETARESAVDALIVGKRGTGNLAGLLLGSISQKLVSLAPCPVTVVPLTPSTEQIA